MRASVCLLLVVSGCGSLPAIAPAKTAGERRAISAACLNAFPEGSWGASHSIDASLPLGNNVLVIGVTSLQKGAMHNVLLSPEGVALFDASVVGNKVLVRRALPPFNRRGFADGLVDDVKATFRPPAGEPAVIGYGESGSGLCRWRSAEDRTTDVELKGPKPAWIRSFDGHTLVREIALSGVPEGGFYPDLLLRVPGVGGYTLRMRLISHESTASEAEANP